MEANHCKYAADYALHILVVGGAAAQVARTGAPLGFAVPVAILTSATLDSGERQPPAPNRRSRDLASPLSLRHVRDMALAAI